MKPESDDQAKCWWPRDYFARSETAMWLLQWSIPVIALLGVAVLAAFNWLKPESPRAVTIYCAQDQVFAEPLFKEFERETGQHVRALLDSEATKTVGLANRLIAEAANPRADLWWSNEEFRTRQLVARGVLKPAFTSFGRRERVLVVNTNHLAGLPSPLTLAALTNAALRGRVALAWPVFGTTATHFLALRERWGAPAWEDWCRALAANRPWLLDGNSVVVKMVGSGQAWVGLTDDDDVVAVGQRNGLPVMAVPLAPAEGLAIPNTLALVRRAPRREAAEKLRDWLASPAVAERLEAAGALSSADAPTPAEQLPEATWSAMLSGLETNTTWLKEVFVR
ncbi:MAG: substrate-binding domain-containing protein [Limisphaerales bacterium]